MHDATLCILVNEQSRQILLGMKKKGFGAGKYNGYGGKKKDSETIEDAAVRELYEEAGIRIANEQLKKKGELTFLFPHVPEDKNWNQVVHVYLITNWQGEPIESDEMKPELFPITKIPYERMWADDLHWLPLVLQGKYVKATFVFGPEEEIIEQKIEIR